MTVPGRARGLVVAASIVCAACSSGHASRPAVTTSATPTAPETTRVEASVTSSGSLAHPTGTSLLFASYTPAGHASLAVLDVDHGTEAPMPLPAGLDPYTDNFQLVRRPAGLVMLGSLDTGAGHSAGPVYWYRSRKAAPTVVGEATVAFASGQPDRVWLTSDLANGIGHAVVGMEEVDLTGHRTATVVLRARAGSVISDVAPVNGGFVVSTASTDGQSGGEVDMFDLAGRVTTTLGQGTLLAAQGSVAVWLSGQHIWVADLATSRRRQLDGAITSGGRPSLSPDGTKLVVAQLPGGTDAEGLLALVDLGTDTITTGPPAGYVVTVWDDSSRDVFFTSPDHHIEVWQVAERTVARLAAPAPDAVAMQPL